MFFERNTSFKMSEKIKNRKSIHAQSRNMISDSADLWDTNVWLFAHPTDGDKCSVSECVEDTSKVDFVLKVARKVRVFE